MAKPGLSKEQLQYARQRLGDFERKEREKLEHDCCLPDDPAVTVSDFVKGVKRGTIKVKGGVPADRHVTRSSLIDTLFDVQLPRGYKRRDDKKLASRMRVHQARWAKIWDQLYLGDAPQALALIQKLESEGTAPKMESPALAPT